MAQRSLPVLDDGLLPDDRVMDLIATLSPAQQLFLAGLGRGLAPGAAARRAGWREEDADQIAAIYMTDHPAMRPLVEHILRLRELALLDDEEPVFAGSETIQ